MNKALLSLILIFTCLPAFKAEAQEYVCEVDSSFVTRNNQGRDSGVRLSGSQICLGQPQLRTFYSNGRSYKDYFRQVKLSNGSNIWVAEKGLDIEAPYSAPVAPPPRPAPRPAFLSAPQTQNQAQTSTSEYQPHTVVTAAAFEIEEGYYVRSTPSDATSNNIVGGTLGNDPDIQIVYQDGMLDVQNEYVRAQRNGQDVWIHQSALHGAVPTMAYTNSQPQIQTAVTSVTPPAVADEPSSDASESPESSEPSEFADSTEVVERPQDAADATLPANVLPSEEVTTPASVLPSGDTPTSETSETSADAAEDAAASTSMAQDPTIDPSLTMPAAVLSNPSQSDTNSSAVDTSLSQIPIPRPIPEGLRERYAASQPNVFENLPANNWGVTTANLNLRNAPGTANSHVQALLQSGGRVAVIDSKNLDGRQWHKVIPFDCELLEVREGGDPNMQSEDPCNETYWLAGDYVDPVTGPTLAEINERPGPLEYTEAGVCEDCRGTAPAVYGDIEDLSEEITAASAENARELYEEYMRFHAAFMNVRPMGNQSPRAWAAANKALFLRKLVESMGPLKAARIVTALTAYGEARGEQTSNETANLGEMAMVVLVLNNRAATNYRTSSHYLGYISSEATPEQRFIFNRAKAALSKPSGQPYGQFSTWNESDNNLGNILLAENDPVLLRAFEAVEMVDNGSITPLGILADNRTRHYQNPNVARNTSWARGQTQYIPEVLVRGSVVRISEHRIYHGVR